MPFQDSAVPFCPIAAGPSLLLRREEPGPWGIFDSPVVSLHSLLLPSHCMTGDQDLESIQGKAGTWRGSCILSLLFRLLWVIWEWQEWIRRDQIHVLQTLPGYIRAAQQVAVPMTHRLCMQKRPCLSCSPLDANSSRQQGAEGCLWSKETSWEDKPAPACIWSRRRPKHSLRWMGQHLQDIGQITDPTGL